MIYFNCTSVFHIFLIAYVMRKNYKGGAEKCTLLMPSHVNNLIEYNKKIRNLGFVEAVCIIDTQNPDISVKEQVNKIGLRNTDIVYLVGWEDIGFSLLENAGMLDCERNVLEEGMFIISSIEERNEFIKRDPHYGYIDYKTSDFNAIYKLDIQEHKSINDYGTNYKNLEFKKYLNDITFLNILRMDMAKVFSNNITETDAPIIWFDTHFIQTRKMAGFSYEKKVLNTIVDVIKKYEYVIKPHPSDNITLKYSEDYNISYNANIPWEIERIMNLDISKSKKHVYLSLTPTGAILNDISIWRTDTIVMFLDKIYKNFGIYPVYEERLNSFMHFAKNEGIVIYRPSNLQEMKVLLDNIVGDSADNEAGKNNDAVNMNCDVENSILAAEYHDISKNISDTTNIGTLYMCVNGVWHIVSSIEYLPSDYTGEMIFNVKNEQLEKLEEIEDESIRFRWYVARGIIVKIKINEITCFSDSGEKTDSLDIAKVQYLDSDQEYDGWQTFNNCDALVEFSANRKLLNGNFEIRIKADIKFDRSFDGMRNLRTRNCETMSKTIDMLTRDNDIREQNITELQGHLNDWINIAKQKDEKISELERKIDEFERKYDELERKHDEFSTQLRQRNQALSSFSEYLKYRRIQRDDNMK